MKEKANLPRETLGGWAVQWVDEQWGEGKKTPPSLKSVTHILQ